MFFFFDSKNIIGRASIRLAAFLSYRFALAHRAKMLFGSQFILACTYGGSVDFLKKERESTTILFRPAVKASDFELWQCKPSSENNCKNIDTFQKVSATLVPLMQGAMYAFVTDNDTERMHYVVKAKKGKKAIASGFVVGKMDTMLTQRNDALLKTTKGEEPDFSWPEKQQEPYWISFLLVHDYTDMITGIYSFLDTWQFPQVAKDVPYYYHERKPVPKLLSGKKHEAVYMAIDREGWVTQMAKKNWTP